jgi:predicted N-formylglutamate amidohydrolase
MSDDACADPGTPVPGGHFDPVEAIAGRDDAGVLFVCDHAANALPPCYGTLGLDPGDLQRHIAYDIGAAWVTRRLAAIFEAPAVLSTFSRLLIDPNRGADDPTLVAKLSDRRIIPGNAQASDEEIALRRTAFWSPYRAAISARIEAMLAAGPVPVVLSIHSFTPLWRGEPRPWQIGVLWDSDPRLGPPLIEALAADGIVTGDNEPYDGALVGDTLDEEVTRRGLAGLLIEIRQDLIDTEENAKAWAARLADVLRPFLERPELHQIQFHPSRTGRHV